MKLLEITVKTGRYSSIEYSSSWDGVKSFMENNITEINVSKVFESSFTIPGFSWHGESYSWPMTASSYEAVTIATNWDLVPGWFKDRLPIEALKKLEKTK